MQLTPFARAFIAVVSLAVIAWVVIDNTREDPLPAPAVEQAGTGQVGAPPAPPAAAAPTGGAPAGMIHIPGGEFMAGQTPRPASVAAFFIDQSEVTLAAYQAQGGQIGAPPPWWQDKAFVSSHGRAPMVSVTFAEAQAHCASQGKRLPTGLEWERAARGTSGFELPWGNEMDRTRARVGGLDPSAVAAAPYGFLALAVDDPSMAGDVSPEGVRGMAGNVAEWTSDQAGPGERMVRGGSWASYQLSDAATWRAVPTREDQRAARIGFRCAVGQEAAANLAPPATDPLARIRATGLLRVGAEPETPPMLVSTPTGGWSGMDYEIAQAIATRLGASVQIVPGRYADLPGLLAQDQIDLIVSGYIPDKGQRGIAWSDPYLEFGLCLVARKGSGIRGLGDLAGKRLGVFNDPAAEARVRGMAPAATVSTWEDGYFQALAQGNLDAFAYDFPYAQAELKPFSATLEIVAYNLSDEVYAVGVQAGAGGLLNEVNAAIKALRSSDTYKRLIRRYLSGAAPVESFAPGEEIYVVKAGDSLSAIAGRKLGDVAAWPRIWEANRHRIGNPDLIDVGMKIAIPKG